MIPENAVFIWIPKTAGTSIHKMLGEPLFFRTRNNLSTKFDGQGLVTFGHMDYALLYNQRLISSYFNRTAFKFAFVRNPYSRAVSLWSYFKRTGKLNEDVSFDYFCGNMMINCESIGAYNTKGWSQCQPQIRWIENVNLDFLGRFERFEQDVQILFEILGMELSEIIHSNPSPHDGIWKYYTPDILELVNQFYSEDFKFFDYETRHSIPRQHTS